MAEKHRTPVDTPPPPELIPGSICGVSGCDGILAFERLPSGARVLRCGMCQFIQWQGPVLGPPMTGRERQEAGEEADAADAERESRHPGGRPSKYEPERMVPQATKLAKLGATDVEVADFFEISLGTLYRWLIQYDELREALKQGKDAQDDRVELSLLRRATGYTFDSEKVTTHAQTGMITRAAIVEHVPPDVTACIFWLKNRRRAEWRDKHELDIGPSESLAELIAKSGMDVPGVTPPKP